MFITIILLYLLANCWIFYSAWPLIQPLPIAVKITIIILFTIVVLLFPSIMFLRNELASLKVGNALYTISSIWLVVTLYLTLLLLLAAIPRLFGITIPHTFTICCLITAALLLYGYITFSNPSVGQLKIEREIKENAEQIKIVMASDIHLGYGITKRRLNRYINLINSQNPDLILICGDLVDSSLEPLKRENMNQELSRLKAKYGLYMVPGNHEYYSGIELCAEYIKTTSIDMLRDSVVTIDGVANIVGRDDKSNPHRKSIDSLMSLTKSSLPTIILDHQPADDQVESAIKNMATLALYGHTHKGQIWPFSLLTKAIYTYNYGYHKVGQTNIYVSSGLGLWGPPFRIGSRSEIVTITLL